MNEPDPELHRLLRRIASALESLNITIAINVWLLAIVLVCVGGCVAGSR